MSKYKSCKYLENGLIFANGIVRFCCINQNEQPNSLYFFQLSGDDFDIDELLNKMNEVRNKIRKDFNNPDILKNHYCKNCHLLVEKEWEPEKIFEIGIAPSDICNLECNYCRTRLLSKNDQKPHYDAMKFLKGLIDRDLLKKDCHLVWNGGEPTLIPNFDESLRYVMERGYNNNEILSNSLKFSPVIYEFLHPCDNKIFKLITSIDAGTPETYKKIKKVDGFNQVCENMKKYASTGGDVIAKYIFTKENNNIKDVKGFLNFICEANIKRVLIDINRCYQLEQYFQFEKMFKYMLDILTKNNIQYWLGAFGVSDSPFIKKMQEYKKSLYRKKCNIAKLKYKISFGEKRKQNKRIYKQLEEKFNTEFN